MRIILQIIKFGLLALLYLFILRVFYIIVNDLRRVTAKQAAGHKVKLALPGENLRAGLVVTESTDPSLREGEIIYLGEETRIGRGPRSHVKMSDLVASHEHAQIIFAREKYLLEDLGSVNGTYINGVRIKEPTPIAQGDAIRIAGATFKFVRWEHEVE